MYQVPINVWNEIADSQPLGKPWAEIFRLTSFEQMVQAMDKMGSELESLGADNRVVVAYQVVAPLLMENEAITSFLVEESRQDLRPALPEVCSVNEAVILASQEYRMTTSQQQQLSQLLTEAMSDPSGMPSEKLTA